MTDLTTLKLLAEFEIDLRYTMTGVLYPASPRPAKATFLPYNMSITNEIKVRWQVEHVHNLTTIINKSRLLVDNYSYV